MIGLMNLLKGLGLVALLLLATADYSPLIETLGF